MSTRKPVTGGRCAEAGFSLVELLIVMLIIGLMAAIAVPSFFAQRDKAFDADAKAAARTAATAVETYATDHDGKYTGATPAGLVAIEPTLANATLEVVVPGDHAYRLWSASDSGNTFTIERRPDGTDDFLCDLPGHAGCPATGEWR